MLRDKNLQPQGPVAGGDGGKKDEPARVEITDGCGEVVRQRVYVRHRLNAVFGKRASLTAGPANGRFTATISIPNVTLAP